MMAWLHQTTRLLLCITILAVPLFAEDPELASDPPPDRDAFFGRIAAPLEEGAFSDRVDPFSGTLTINMVDFRLPGKGGLDVVVQRYYASSIWDRVDFPSRHVPFYDPADHLGGSGWQLHMGKVVRPAGIGSPTPGARQNPVVIMPDGSTHTLYNSTQFSGEKITRERWRFKATSGGWDLTTTDGLTYSFNSTYQDSHAVVVAQCTQIKDLSNNTITITYNGTQISRITDTFGRFIDFSYFSGSSRVQYVRVKNGSTVVQTWEYKYASQGTLVQDNGLTRELFALTEVIPPIGAKWLFEYYPNSLTPAQGGYCIKKVTWPTGGTIEYQYVQQAFDTGTQSCTIPFLATSRRVTGGRAITSGTWQWTYTNAGKEDATTAVSGPNGYSEQHVFHGWEPYQTQYANIWRVGLPKQRSTTVPGQTTVETLSWAEANATPGTANSRLSNDYVQTTNWVGCASFRYRQGIRPLTNGTVTRAVTRGSKTYTTTFSQYDDFGNPALVSEGGDVSRTTTLTYWYTPLTDTKNLLAGRIGKQVVAPGEKLYIQRDTIGRVIKEVRNGNSPAYESGGLVTELGYNASGDLYSIKDGRGNTTYHQTYTWGVPLRTDRPDGSRIYRQVGFLGLVEKETDGRGGYVGAPGTTTYSYDLQRRLTRIDLYPAGPPNPGPITFTYATDGSTATATRGTFSRTSSYDGFGRLTRISDTLNHVEQLTISALGMVTQKAFTFGGLAGDTIAFDALNRVTTITHPGGKTVTYTYSSTSSDVTVRNERNYSTSFAYQAFGDPDARRLSRVTEAVGSPTSYTYDSLFGKLATVNAPGTAGDRSWTYLANGLLGSETHKEIGAVSYEYDLAGNMTKRTKPGPVATIYSYDSMNRLTNIDYAGAVADVTIGYDPAGNRTLVATGPTGSRATEVTLEYDGKGWLSKRTQKVGALSFVTTFTFDASGNLQEMVYPSGRKVTYAYNNGFQVTGVTGKTPASVSTTYASSLSYHASGKMAGITYANTVATTLSYDTRFRLSGITAGTSGAVLKLTMGYDDTSNMTSWTDQRDTAWSKTFGYDAVDRLTSAALGSSTSLGFTYNELGNRLTHTWNGTPVTYTYDTNNRLVSLSDGGTFTYDSRGNRKTGPWSIVPSAPGGGSDEVAAAAALLPSESGAGDGTMPGADGTSSARRPRKVIGLEARAGDSQVTLRWERAHSSFATRLVRREGSFPLSPADGEVVYEGSAATWTDRGLANGTRYHYAAFSVDTQGRFGSEATAAATPRADLVAFFDFEDPLYSGAAVDISGHDHVLATPAGELAEGVRGRGLRSAAGRIELDSEPRAPDAGFTVEVWVRRIVENVPVAVLSIGDLELRVDGDGHLGLQAEDTFSASAATLGPNSWHHVVAVASNGVLRVVVDGTEAATWTRASVAPLDELALPLGPNAVIDELRVYRGALTAGEALAHYRDESFVLAASGDGSDLFDLSGHGHHGSVEGGRWAEADGIQVLDLALAGAFGSVPYSPELEPSRDGGAIELWLRARGPQEGMQHLAGRDTFALVLSDGKPAVHVKAGGRDVVIEAPEPIRIAAWHHVAAVRGRDGGVLLYVDGCLSARSGPHPIPDESDEGLLIGGVPGMAGASFNGELSGITIHRRALHPAEVAQSRRGAAARSER